MPRWLVDQVRGVASWKPSCKRFDPDFLLFASHTFFNLSEALHSLRSNKGPQETSDGYQSSAHFIGKP